MDDRQVKGTTDWKKYELVLDVPSDASLIGFGIMLGGKGQIWEYIVADSRFHKDPDRIEEYFATNDLAEAKLVANEAGFPGNGSR